MSQPPYPSDPQQPQPYGGAGVPATTSEERTWAMAAHLGCLLAAWAAMAFLAPLIVMLVKKDSPFVRRHAVESLNFQISALIYGVVGVVLSFLLIGIPLLIALAIFWLVVVILAGIRANNGQDYRYPLTIRLIS